MQEETVHQRGEHRALWGGEVVGPQAVGVVGDEEGEGDEDAADDETQDLSREAVAWRDPAELEGLVVLAGVIRGADSHACADEERHEDRDVVDGLSAYGEGDEAEGQGGDEDRSRDR